MSHRRQPQRRLRAGALLARFAQWVFGAADTAPQPIPIRIERTRKPRR
ncbi:MAG: hypothetical protein KDJ27_21110 [Gammaproteobacteria bacterium]|nr:hypothetical protein [Gammaproteobacteria bacterium]MCB1926199.1 hypothetical protein [Gammaproteobacteria bacterium]